MKLKYINFLVFLAVSLTLFEFGLFEENVLDFKPEEITLSKGSKKLVEINLKNPTNNFSFMVNFTYGDENKIYNDTSSLIIIPIKPLEFQPFDNKTREIEIDAIDVGHLVIGAESNEIKIPFGNIFRINVIHSEAINIIIQITGWIYFFAWSISFYPQIILNYKLKDVSGLSFDFMFLNLLGHTCYAVYNVSFYWFSKVQNEYFAKHPRGVNPVLLNDVLFSLHASTITLLTAVQCLYYRKRGHRLSRIATVLLICFFLFLIISGIVCSFSKLSVLDYIYFFSYVKLAITLIKYIPQAYLNFKRKSTIGWSIENVLLDFTGGTLSLIQMFFLAYNYNDWTSIFGSPAKLGLGLFSIFFDIIFTFQHYVLYKNVEYDYSPIS